MLNNISDTLIKLIKLIFNMELTDEIEIEIDYWIRLVCFNMFIFVSLLTIGYFTHTLLQMFIIGVVVNLGYDGEDTNRSHMGTLEQCILFTIIIVSISALIARFTYIHPLLCIISILLLSKDVPFKSKVIMFMLSILAFISSTVSISLFMGLVLVFFSHISTFGKEFMLKLSNKLTKS